MWLPEEVEVEVVEADVGGGKGSLWDGDLLCAVDQRLQSNDRRAEDVDNKAESANIGKWELSYKVDSIPIIDSIVEGKDKIPDKQDRESASEVGVDSIEALIGSDECDKCGHDPEQDDAIEFEYRFISDGSSICSVEVEPYSKEHIG